MIKSPAPKYLLLMAFVVPFGRSLSGQNDAPSAPPPVIRADARLVLLDVIVTDKHGNLVRDLAPDDFTVTENGVPQKISKVESHLTSVTASPAAAPPVAPAGASAARFTNRPPGGEPVWNVILLDPLDTALEEQARSRKLLLEFIKTLPADRPIALASMGSRLTVLVPFQSGAGTVDKLLAASLASPRSSPLLDIYNPDDQEIAARIQSKMRDHGAAMRANAQSQEMDRLGQRVQTIFAGFDSLAAWLGKYPGKKNVYWLSTGFPLVASPKSFADDSSPTQSFRGLFAQQQRELDKNLQLARVAIFPIDVRGVLGDFNGMRDATYNGGQYAAPGGGQALSADMDNFENEQSQQLLEEMDIAEATGGIAKFNSNDISGLLQSAYQQSQNYYTVAYAPTNRKWNGDYRKINITAKQRGYQLAYRRGYYAVDVQEKAPTPDQFTLALRKGAAPSTAVLFTASLKKSPETIVLDYSVDVHTLQFSADADGRSTAGLDCAVVEYDRAGKVLGTNEIHVDGKVRPGQWSRVEQTGFPAHQTVPLDPGAASITIGIRDHSSGQYGNMEVALAR